VELSTKLCESAGNDTPTCTWVKRVTGLFEHNTCQLALADVDKAIARMSELAKPCTELGNRLCNDLGETTESCQMVRGELPNIDPTQCEQMGSQYDSILADLRSREERNQPLSDELVEALAANEPPGWGPKDAKVTIVLFSDFQCPYCARAAESAEQLKRSYGERARLIFRHFPLPFHQEAHLAAQAAMAAHAQGKFWDYHDRLFAHQDALTREDLEHHAVELGLDMAKFKKALDEGTYRSDVDADLELGKRVAVEGTPTIFVGKKRMVGADPEELSRTIDAALGS